MSRRSRDEQVFEDTTWFADENEGMGSYTFSDRVKKRLSDLGIGNYDRPRLEEDHEGLFKHLKTGQYFDGRMPTVIRKFSLDQLSALYSLYSNWNAYITSKFMEIATERSEAAHQKSFMLNHLKNHYRRPGPDGSKIPETAVTDAAKTDKRYISANARYEELTALYNMLEAMRDVTSQDMKVISREVTIQQEKLRKDLLMQGFENRGRGDRSFDQALGGGDDYGYGTTAPQNPTGGNEPPPERQKVRVPRVQRKGRR